MKQSPSRKKSVAHAGPTLTLRVDIIVMLVYNRKSSWISMDYATRVANETRLYRDLVEIHGLPEIFHYWSNRYVRPKLEAFGFSTPEQMFRKYIVEQCLRHQERPKRFVSLGSGNCDLEIGLAREDR